MSFLKSKTFKYLKNLLIGVGAAIVLIGALLKLESLPYASEMLTVGLVTEAIIFLLLGILGPEPDYYWDKLYPGLSDYGAKVQPIANSLVGGGAPTPAMNGEVMERQLGGMLNELQGMSKSLGALKSLQEVDFSGTSEQVKTMSNFYAKMNEAMNDMAKSSEDVKAYKDNIAGLNKNLGSLNSVYGNMLTAMSSGAKA